MKLSILITILGFTAFQFASADSSCWPEEQLIGKTATAFIEGINFKIPKPASAKDKCVFEAFSEKNAKTSSLTACNQLECIKGECGDDGDYTSLPVEAHDGNWVQSKLKNGKMVWLKFSETPEIKEVLPVGKDGTLSPEKTSMLNAPNGKAVTFKSAKKLGYTMKKITKIGKAEWAQVDVRPILSEEPEVQLDKPLGQAFFLHRNQDGRVQAVLSDIFCD